MWKNWKNLFFYSKSDRRVLFFLGGFISGAMITALLFLYEDSSRLYARHDDIMSLSSGDSSLFDSVLFNATFYAADGRSEGIPVSSVPYYVEERRPETFAFDPNTADSTTLLRLGLSSWQVRNIYKYRAAGGRYHRPEDFSSLYGLTKGDYERLLPYIRISDEFKLIADLPDYRKSINKGRGVNSDSAGTQGEYTEYERVNRVSEGVNGASEKIYGKYSEKYAEGTRIDLNSADTSMLKKIPGIGSYYARCIVNYRERLGGFSSVGQLYEIEGLPEDIDRWFISDGIEPIKKIQVNRLSMSAMRRHPYLDFYQCKAILEHRRKYGPIRNLESLSLYEEFSESDLSRLRPYLSFE